MVEFYLKLIKANKLTLADVPIKWRDKVGERLTLKTNQK